MRRYADAQAMTRGRESILGRLPQALFGVYALAVFALCVLFSLFVAVFVPGLERRRRLVAGAARASFLLSGVRPRVDGLENLPDGQCVVVANHASYVDGVLLKGFLPARFSFVIKGEMRNVPVAHFLMRRSGARFVERYKSAESARDARQIVRAARGGESLGFFPEGTFLAEPGVGRFRPGAFVAAIKAVMPVVPIAISGTRRMLPSGAVLPRRERILVEILPAIAPDDPAFGDSRTLAEAARQRILAVLDEPDLLAA
jgi:1-acyl-sn-glycerol-3-phosphate acyltransferase